MRPAWRASQNPRLVDQFGKIDLTATGPRAGSARNDDQFVVEHDLRVEIVEGIAHEWMTAQPLHDEIKLTFAQLRVKRLDFLFVHVEHHARILPRKAFDNWKEDRRDPIRATDLDFAGGRVGQELDVPNPLLQLIEGRTAACQQGTAVNRR